MSSIDDKIIAILIGIIIGGLCISLFPVTPQTPSNSTTHEIVVYKQCIDGVEYLSDHGLTPHLHLNGKPYLCEKNTVTIR